MKHLAKRLSWWYYAIFLKAILVATLGYFCVLNQWLMFQPEDSISVTIYSFIILYVITSTPLALKLFNNHVQKLVNITDTQEKLEHYERYAKIRLLVVTFGLLTALFFYYTLQQQALLWVAGISAIALYFCKPSLAKIEQDLQLTNPNDGETQETNLPESDQ